MWDGSLTGAPLPCLSSPFLPAPFRAGGSCHRKLTRQANPQMPTWQLSTGVHRKYQAVAQAQRPVLPGDLLRRLALYALLGNFGPLQAICNARGKRGCGPHPEAVLAPAQQRPAMLGQHFMPSVFDPSRQVPPFRPGEDRSPSPTPAPALRPWRRIVAPLSSPSASLPTEG